MSIHKIWNKQLLNVNEPKQVLQQGQIVHGKIIKIFPENKVEIQIGSRNLIAHLEAPLTIGKGYHFLVDTLDGLLHLKVINKQAIQNNQRTSINLLEQLGLKTTKAAILFTQSLIQERIPFDKNQLIRAVNIYESATNKQEALGVLKEMIASKLPISNSVFQALTNSSKHTVGEAMGQLLHLLKQTAGKSMAQEMITSRLSQLMDRPVDSSLHLVRQVQQDLVNQNNQLFHITKAAGLIKPNLELSQWQASWQNVINKTEMAINDVLQSVPKKVVLPFQINSDKLMTTLQQWLSNQSEIQQQVNEVIKNWGEKLTKTVVLNESLAKDDFTQFKQVIAERVLSLLVPSQRQQITNLIQQNVPIQLKELLSILTTIKNDDTYMTIKQMLAHVSHDEKFLLSQPKEQFLLQLQTALRSIGITLENDLLSDGKQLESTVKAALLQLVQQSDGQIQERGQQLLHILNGLQLKSVTEMNQLIIANLQIPAERIGLKKGIDLEFSGRKNKDGMIDPDFCRILFYLDLANLNETVIDMYIQKRTIALTVFNDQPNIKLLTKALQGKLKTGLEKLNYQLSTVTVKTFGDQGEKQVIVPDKANDSRLEGVDFRI